MAYAGYLVRLRPKADVDAEYLAHALAEARDEGLLQLDEIAERESRTMGIDRETCLEYLRDNLHFRLGPEELAGLARFEQMARAHGLITQPPPRKLHDCAIG